MSYSPNGEVIFCSESTNVAYRRPSCGVSPHNPETAGVFNQNYSEKENGNLPHHNDYRTWNGIVSQSWLVDISDSDEERESVKTSARSVICKYLILFVHIMRRLASLLIRWRTHIMIVCILVLALYIIFIDPSATIDIPNGSIDIDELEQELEIGNPVRLVSYKSMMRDNENVISSVNKSKYARDYEFEHSISRKLKYNKIWQWAHNAVNRDEMFPESPEVDDVVTALNTAVIVNVDILERGRYESGTSEKWVVTLEGGQKAMLKIIWEDKGSMKNGALCNFGYEMPSGEIAAFHLHRILGFRNTPYVSGRVVDLRRDILPVASPAVVNQILVKSDNETCVEGKCYFCKEKLRLCPVSGKVEVSLAYWLPRRLELFTYPPDYMPFSTPSMDEWGSIGFNNRTYCDKIRKEAPYGTNYYYYDLFDFAVLDTLMYHFDTKHYAVDDDTMAKGLTIRLDHGRAFCAYDRDDVHIFMAPITQCCTLRSSTYKTLIDHRDKLGEELRESVSKDPLSPVLLPDWYPAMDRRLNLILNMMQACADANGGWDKVLVDG